MSSLPSSHVSNGDPVADGADPSFGNALERVYGAGQELIVRRIDLLVEELAAQGRISSPLPPARFSLRWQCWWAGSSS